MNNFTKNYRRIVGMGILFMKISVLPLFLLAWLASVSMASPLHGQDLLARRISIKVEKTPLKEVLQQLSRQSDVRFSYNNKRIAVDSPVSFVSVNEPLGQVLERLLSPLGIGYTAYSRLVVLRSLNVSENEAERGDDKSEALEPVRVVSGQVTDEKKEGLPGVNVTIKGTTVGTTTDVSGNYNINVTDDQATLVFSSIGFVRKEIVVGNQSTITVSLAADQQSLDEVVVVGYGTQRRGNVTGAVASFNAESLDQRPVGRVDQALVGQMAGVTVKQTTGALGKGMSIQIRGTGSITAGNEPLYVVDGFPLSTTKPGSSGNYSTGNPLDNFNPNDIEDIQVLKDAAAAAIYGSRAANGVVLITTKKGKSGKPTISLNSYVGFAGRSKKLDMLNGEEWISKATEIINGQWAASGTGRSASQSNEERRVILGLAAGTVNTAYMTDDRWAQPGHPGLRFIDWQDETFRQGFLQNHQLSLSGGNDNVRYYVSGNYAGQQGMIIHTDYTSYSVRANVEVKANKALKFGFNLSPTYSINNDPGLEGKDAILHQVIGFAPVQEESAGIYPNMNLTPSYRWGNSPNSPVGFLENGIGQAKLFRTLASVYGEWQIAKGLSFKSTVNLDNVDKNTKNFVPYNVRGNVTTRQAQLSGLSTGSFNGLRKQTLVNENTLNFSKTIKDDHDISVLGGFSFNHDKIERVTIATTAGYSIAGIQTLNAAVAPLSANTTETENTLISYFGRVQYGFRNKYLLSASLRRDGSSRFGPNNKWGTFPSASVGWRVSEEGFMKSVNLISDLKFRASWGVAGNYNIPDYAYPTLGINNYPFGTAAVIGQAPNKLYNPDLTWETSKTFNVGADFGILKNRITASIDYYTKLNYDLLFNVPVLAATGYQIQLGNSGDIRNKGWELELRSRNVVGKNFQWTTTFNVSHNKNKLVSLPNGQSQLLIPSAFDISHSILRVGEPVFSMFVVKQIGILSQADINDKVARYGAESAGDPKYFDADGNGTIDANDRVIMGHPNPDYTFGITNTFKYRGFDLSVLVQGQQGGSIYSLLGRAINRTGTGFTDNIIGGNRNRYVSPEKPGDGMTPKAYSTFGRIKNTDWLYSSDYLRIRNINLGYDLGQLIKVKQLQSVRLYLTLENYFGWDKYRGGFNPEASNTDVSGNENYLDAGDYGGMPLPKSVVFGVNINF